MILKIFYSNIMEPRRRCLYQMSLRQKHQELYRPIDYIKKYLGGDIPHDGLASQSLTTMSIRPNINYEAQNYPVVDNTVCNSSLLSRQAVGDIVSVEKKTDFIQQHEKINVNLQITKITTHISNFDFEEEFEVI